MVISVVVAIAKQPPHGLAQEFQANRKWRGPPKQTGAFRFRQVADGLEVQRDGLVQETEYLLERFTLNRDVEIEADCLPIAISP